MKIEVSEKHIGLRIAVTAVALVIAVVAFTIGVVNIGKKTTGYQNIEAKVDAEAITYNDAVLYRYWFGGTSNEIKRSINALVLEYTPILSAAYKQTDYQNTYSGQVSIGTINQHPGEIVTVSAELYAILKDAYAKTLEGRGYNIFAGALYAEWKSIQILENPAEFDPANNENTAERLHAIAEQVNDLSNFNLEFLDDSTCSLRFSTASGYDEFCREYEIAAPALDLNNLRDAYMLSMMGEALVADGYSIGHLTTPAGLALNTSPRGSLAYDMHTWDYGKDSVYASVELDGVFSAATFTAYGMGSDYGYSLETSADPTASTGSNGIQQDPTASTGSNRLYRHLYFDVRTGDFTDVLMSATIISRDMDIVGNTYESIILNTLGTEQEVSAYAADLEKAGKLVSYVFQSTQN